MTRRLVLAACGVGGMILAGLSCRVPNTDHCLHKAIDANLWCSVEDEDRPFCSPCEGEDHGCVETEPTASDCPQYSASPSETGDDTGTGDDAGTGASDDSDDMSTDDTG